MVKQKLKVLIAEELSPKTRDALGSKFEILFVDGTDRRELLAAIAEVHAVLVRSATQIDREALSAAKNLRVVARAGVGLDNIDVNAATEAGVMVVNAPSSNVVSAAEITLGHILASARNIPQAHASLSSGEWRRADFVGVELFGKTVGIIGLGRIGSLVAERLAGFGVELIGFDPHVQPVRASQIGVELTTLKELMTKSDFITIHIPKTPETTGLIGFDELRSAKKTLRLVNASRGGIVDEVALARALSEGVIAAAGIDVFANEPPLGSPLLTLPNIVVTPHLGASTKEAQENAGESVARSVKLALEGELVPDAVNVSSGVIEQSVRPGIPLMEKLGQVFVGLSDEPIASINVQIRGEIVEHDVTALKLAALKGIFSRIVGEQVTYVNAPLIAGARGVEVVMTTDVQSDDYRNVLTIRGVLGSGRTISVSGTLTGAKQIEKLVEINGYDIEVPLSRHHIAMTYEDRPGIVAVYGRTFGEAHINIAGMQVARDVKGGKAMSVLTVDSPVPQNLLDELAEEILASEMAHIDIVEL